MKKSILSDVKRFFHVQEKKNLWSIVWVLLFLSIPAAMWAQKPDYKKINDRYDLKEVVVLSRHNIRAPLSGKNSMLGKVTTHQWTEWTSNPSELTLRGGQLETIMGQYFRKWLESENLFKEGECPNVDEVNIYANSMQRTIATANYFKTGFFPTCDMLVNHRFSPSKMDPIFFPRLTKMSDAFKIEAMKELNAMGGKNGVTGWTESLKPSFDLFERMLDMKDSPACKEDNICGLNDYNTQLIFKLGAEPNLSGSLKLANTISDALILQYFEVSDDKEAAFGQDLTQKDWDNVARVKDVYGDILFSAPIVAVNVAHPLLVYLKDELNAKDRKLTYLVGHDSNIASVNSALEVEEYSLPNTIEKKTPIGCKLVFEKWVEKTTGDVFVSVNIMYQSAEQLRQVQALGLNNPPMVYQLRLKGLKANDLGLYNFANVDQRFDKAIRAYEEIK